MEEMHVFNFFSFAPQLPLSLFSASNSLLLQCGHYLINGEKHQSDNFILITELSLYFLFLSGFSFTNINDSQDCGGRGR